MNVYFFAGPAEHVCTVEHQFIDIDGLYLIFASTSETQKLFCQASRTLDTLLNGFDVLQIGVGRLQTPTTSVKNDPECPSVNY